MSPETTKPAGAGPFVHSGGPMCLAERRWRGPDPTVEDRANTGPDVSVGATAARTRSDRRGPSEYRARCGRRSDSRIRQLRGRSPPPMRPSRQPRRGTERPPTGSCTLSAVATRPANPLAWGRLVVNMAADRLEAEIPGAKRGNESRLRGYEAL